MALAVIFMSEKEVLMPWAIAMSATTKKQMASTDQSIADSFSCTSMLPAPSPKKPTVASLSNRTTISVIWPSPLLPKATLVMLNPLMQVYAGGTSKVHA